MEGTGRINIVGLGLADIDRFARAVCYQDAPKTSLPEELRDANPAGIARLVNGVLEQSAPVSGVARVVLAAMGRDQDADAAGLAQVDEVDPLANLPRAPGVFPQDRHVGVESVAA